MDDTVTKLAVTVTAILVISLLLRRQRVLCLPSFGQPLPKLAYLNTEDASKWDDQLDIFSRALDLPKSCFERFDCYRGEFPPAEALRRGVYTGVLITGSHYSSVDPNLAWLEGLFQCVRTCEALPHVNVLGCCFGCQAAAVALGGTVGPNPGGGFVFGVEDLHLAPRAVSHRSLRDPPLSARVVSHAVSASAAATVEPSRYATLRLLETHGEQVLSLPEGAILLASSATATHELFLAGRYQNVLCLQAHPEFDRELLQSRIEPALIEKGRLSDEQLTAIRKDPVAFYSCERGSQVGRRLYRTFLLHGPEKALKDLSAAVQ